MIQPMTDYYRSSEAYAEMLRSQQQDVFTSYVELWKTHVAPSCGPVLDIGCGIGSSTLLLRKEGYAADGSDVSSRFLPAGLSGFFEADFTDARNVPDDSYAAIGCMNVIEHVEQPERFLSEMVRSVRPGGHVLILAPHLSTPIVVVRIVMDLLTGKTPYLGVTTLAGAVKLFMMNLWRVARAELGINRFAMRQAPLHTGIVGYDVDAVYWTNAAEIRRHLESRGCDVVRYQQQGRSTLAKFIARMLPGLAGQVCIVARKR